MAFGRDSAAATQRGVKHEDIYHFYVWQSESVLSGMDVLRGENFIQLKLFTTASAGPKIASRPALLRLWSSDRHGAGSEIRGQPSGQRRDLITAPQR